VIGAIVFSSLAGLGIGAECFAKAGKFLYTQAVSTLKAAMGGRITVCAMRRFVARRQTMTCPAACYKACDHDEGLVRLSRETDAPQ